MTKAEALRFRHIIEKAAESLDDSTVSTAPSLLSQMQYNGSLIKAGTRLNFCGTIKRAAVDLWDREENNPDNAPTLWESIDYKDGYRIIPEIITVGKSFSLGEYGWWRDELYESLLDVNVYTPEQYPAGWRKINS